jgi:hypothetical protein
VGDLLVKGQLFVKIGAEKQLNKIKAGWCACFPKNSADEYLPLARSAFG